MRRDESGYVTVEHAVGFVAVTLMIGVIVAVAQAGITGSSLCQAVREGARAASIGAQDPQAAARAAYAPGTYAVTRSGGWVSVAGSAPYRGVLGWSGGVARCTVTTLDEGNLP
ncbi:MAG: TadE/TadG family type IV pilus assembly protein [Pauljensenia sp.]